MTNHIICVIDRSGSMQAMRGEAIGGFNNFIEQQRKDGTDDIVTFVQFDNEYEPVCIRRPIDQVEALDRNTYVPRGTTALYDAIGYTIENTRYWGHPDDKTILLILTDGHENASKEFGKNQVKELIQHHKREFGWNVVYVGPEIDAFDVGAGLGVSRGDVIPYHVSRVGTRTAYASAASTVSSHKTFTNKEKLSDEQEDA